jgi:hypothetical protein
MIIGTMQYWYTGAQTQNVLAGQASATAVEACVSNVFSMCFRALLNELRGSKCVTSMHADRQLQSHRRQRRPVPRTRRMA